MLRYCSIRLILLCFSIFSWVGLGAASKDMTCAVDGMPEAATVSAIEAETDWPEVFRARGLTYLTKNTELIGKTEDLYGIKSHLHLKAEEVAFCFFRALEQPYVIFHPCVEAVLKKQLSSSAEGLVYLAAISAERITYFQLRKKWEESIEIREMFLRLVTDNLNSINTEIKKYYLNCSDTELRTGSEKAELYLDEMDGVETILRTKTCIRKFHRIGSYAGCMRLFNPRNEDEKPDMYLIELYSTSFRKFVPATSFLSLSAKLAGNEFRFMSTAPEEQANVILIPLWNKMENSQAKIRYCLNAYIFSCREIAPGQQLIAYYGRDFLAEIVRQTGRPIIQFCVECTEALPPTVQGKTECGRLPTHPTCTRCRDSRKN